MILANAPQHEAILSNVGEIGEFRIRNSAKAFSILSSGLYANKIRAIIRELSCNAVDSHIAAGKASTPFDVHLPNSLEPWFSVRDYGTGLTHDQVTNIYTTYFESTKTESNEFTGALGLGSKSPFSYTDNFTVTAIKDGVRGIYSAFINGSGVPSIVKMMDEESTDPNGVEVKFSVNDRWDFDKFKNEASVVFTHFKLRPVVSGHSGFRFIDPEYTDFDIVPGVHSTGKSASVAIMGNISYPIAIPESDTVLGELRSMLVCGLVINFEIGELDFQASREGLSYIPQTIDAIKAKLELVNAALTVRLATDADKITNMWERAIFLSKKKDSSLWRNAVIKYVTDTKFPYVNVSTGYLSHFTFTESDLAAKFNIVVRRFSKHRSYAAATNKKPKTTYVRSGPNGQEVSVTSWDFHISSGVTFVENDTTVGGFTRAKYHWRHSQTAPSTAYTEDVFVLEKSDKTKAMNTAGFFKELANPPAKQIKVVSSLLKKEREVTTRAKNVTILKLVRRDSYSRRLTARRYDHDDVHWIDAGKAAGFTGNAVHYYMPLSGFTMESKVRYSDAKVFYADLTKSGIASLHNETVYGVRKSDIEFIKTQKNWVNIEDHVSGVLTAPSDTFKLQLTKHVLDSYRPLCYNASIDNLITDRDCEYVKLALKYKDVVKFHGEVTHLQRLYAKYAPNIKLDIDTAITKVKNECMSVYTIYPLLKDCNTASNPAIAQYINLINASKKEIK